MSRFLLRTLLPLGVLFLAATVRADAPGDQYASFTGDSTTIVDRYTQLTWTRTVQSTTTFANAVSVCQNTVKDENLNGGFRLPTLKELLTIVDEDPHQEFQAGQTVLRAIDQNAFPKTPVGPFWTYTRSDSVGVGPPVDVYAVSFDTGEAVSKPASEQHVFRCVR